MVLVDTHCHLNTLESYPDLDEVLQRARQAGVAAFVVVGIDEEHTPLALQLADEHEDVFAVVGVHPNCAATFDSTMRDKFARWMRHPRVVAAGETGLDLFRDRATLAQQRTALEWHLERAREAAMPLVFHCRQAYSELFEVLQSWSGTIRGVLHCFSGTIADADRALQLGLHLGFDGPVTYKKAETTREVARICPANRMLLETDSPYLPPEPYRGKRNEPAYLHLIARAVAAARGESVEQIADQSTRNARELFGLPAVST